MHRKVPALPQCLLVGPCCYGSYKQMTFGCRWLWPKATIEGWNDSEISVYKRWTDRKFSSSSFRVASTNHSLGWDHHNVLANEQMPSRLVLLRCCRGVHCGQSTCGFTNDTQRMLWCAPAAECFISILLERGWRAWTEISAICYPAQLS